MAIGELILTLESYSLTLTRFDSVFCREQVEISRISKNSWGTTVLDGLLYDPPNLWDFTTHLTWSEAQLLLKMWALWNTVPHPTLIISDGLTPYTEVGRSRPLAFGAEPTPDSEGVVLYYAQFSAHFGSYPKLSKINERLDRVSAKILLSEGDKLTVA